MEQNQETGKQNRVRAIGLPALSVFLAAIAVGVGTYATLQQGRPFLTLTNLPADTMIDISLTQQGKTSALALQENNEASVEEARPQGNYTLTIAFKDTAKNQFRDVVISYRADTGAATILADGFSSLDTIALSGAETLRFDWSGKIELAAPSKLEDSNLCLETSAGISLCHALPERTGA